MALVMGIHSGTSMDAIAVAVIDVTERDGGRDDIDLVASREYPYSDSAQSDLIELAAADSVTLQEVSRLNAVVSEEFVGAAESFVADSDLGFADVDVVGTYGQTVGHYPRDDPPSTLQLGEAVAIAEGTGVDTVSNFFSRDLAAGGAGAPLIMQFDYAHYADPDENRLVLNVGGIANFTYLPAGGGVDDVRAFDTGPGNMLIDATVRELTDGEELFDEDGRRGARGEVSEELLADLMDHDYVTADPPKSSGRTDFGERERREMRRRADELGVSGDDLVATFTAFTAEAIAHNRREFVGDVDRTIVFGGGSQNPTLMAELDDRLDGDVVVAEDLGYRHEAREVMGTAYVGYRSWRGKQTNVPSATGSRPVCGGALARGSVETED